MTDSSYPSDKQDKFMLRFPDGMRSRIKDYATRHRRSMNQVIIDALEEAFPDLGEVTFGQLIRSRRQDAGIGLTKLALNLMVERGLLIDIEADRAAIDSAVLLSALIEALDISFDEALDALVLTEQTKRAKGLHSSSPPF